MLFPGFYLVICTSDLNSSLGIYDANKVLQEATPHPPKLLLQIWGSHKSGENDPKNAEIR